MKKEMTRKILVVSFLALLMISVIAVVVSAADIVNEQGNQQTAKTGFQLFGENAKASITKIFGSTFIIDENTRALISKLLLMALLIMIVYSVMSFIPFFEKESIKWISAIIIGILSFLFISADDIRYILITYMGLGIILTSVIPFIVIIAFSLKLRQAKWTQGSAFEAAISGAISKVIIIAFVIYVAVRWFMLAGQPQLTGTASDLIWLYPIMILLGIIWFFVERRAFMYLEAYEMNTLIDRAKENGKLALAREIQEAYEETIAGARSASEVSAAKRAFASRLDQLTRRS